jgi:hypothetical protein
LAQNKSLSITNALCQSSKGGSTTPRWRLT